MNLLAKNLTWFYLDSHENDCIQWFRRTRTKDNKMKIKNELEKPISHCSVTFLSIFTNRKSALRAADNFLFSSQITTKPANSFYSRNSLKIGTEMFIFTIFTIFFCNFPSLAFVAECCMLLSCCVSYLALMFASTTAKK